MTVAAVATISGSSPVLPPGRSSVVAPSVGVHGGGRGRLTNHLRAGGRAADAAPEPVVGMTQPRGGEMVGRELDGSPESEMTAGGCPQVSLGEGTLETVWLPRLGHQAWRAG